MKVTGRKAPTRKARQPATAPSDETARVEEVVGLLRATDLVRGAGYSPPRVPEPMEMRYDVHAADNFRLSVMDRLGRYIGISEMQRAVRRYWWGDRADGTNVLSFRSLGAMLAADNRRADRIGS